GWGGSGIAPRWIKGGPSEASIDCCVERTEGSSTTATISLNSTLGDNRANAWRVSSTPKISPAVVTASASAGENSGQRIVRNSHSPSATRAAVAAERKRTEHSSASANQRP